VGEGSRRGKKIHGPGPAKLSLSFVFIYKKAHQHHAGRAQACLAQRDTSRMGWEAATKRFLGQDVV